MQHDPVVVIGHVRHPTIVFDTVMKSEYTETKKSTRPPCNAHGTALEVMRLVVVRGWIQHDARR